MSNPIADAGSDGSECGLNYTLSAVAVVGVGTWVTNIGTWYNSIQQY